MSFLSYLINGVSLGSIYAIIALGYTMVYGIAKMLNFAHGDVIMIGAFVMLSALNTMSLPLIPAVLVAVVACTVLGVVIERVAYRPLRNAASPLAVLITAIGVSYLLQNVALLIFGANTVSFPNKITLPALSRRRKPGDFFCYNRNDRGVRGDYDRTAAVYQQDKGRTGNAGCLRG